MAGERPRDERNGQLQEQPGEEDARVQKPRNVTAVDEALDVLLHDEGCEGRDRKRPRGRNPQTDGEAPERESGGGEHEQELRRVGEVRVKRVDVSG